MHNRPAHSVDKNEEAKAWADRAEALRLVATVAKSPGGAQAAQLANDWKQRAENLKKEQH